MYYLEAITALKLLFKIANTSNYDHVVNLKFNTNM